MGRRRTPQEYIPRQGLVKGGASASRVEEDIQESFGGGAPAGSGYILTASDPGLEGSKVLGADIIMRGTLAGRPTAGIAGRLYYVTDAGDERLTRDNGTTWDDLGHDWSYTTSKPTLPVLVIVDAADMVWTDMPAVLTEFIGSTRWRTKVDLTQVAQVRLLANVMTAGFTGAELRGEFSTDGTVWNSLDGGTGPSVVIDTVGLKVSALVNLAAGAKADVFLRVIGINGNGVVDPAFGAIYLQVR